MSEGVTSPGAPSELSSPSFRGSPAQSPPPVATTVHTSLKNRTTSAIYDNALYDGAPIAIWLDYRCYLVPQLFLHLFDVMIPDLTRLLFVLS